MKKGFLRFFRLLAATAVLAQICAPLPGLAQTHTGPKQVPKDWPKVVVFGGAPVGTGAYSVFVAISGAVTKDLGASSQVIGDQNATAGIYLMERGQMIGGWVSGEAMMDAITGQGAFKGKPSKTLRTLCLMDPVPFPIITYPGSGVKSGADLKGKKWLVLRAGSRYGQDMADGICDANGFTRKDTTALTWTSPVTMGDNLQSKVVHAIMGPISPGSAYGEDLARSMKVTYVSLTEAEVRAMQKHGPYLMTEVLPPNSYHDQTQPLRVICNPNFFAVSSMAPESLIYQLCHLLMDDPKRFVPVHPTIGEFSFQPSFMDTPPQAPYHPGVVKYLKEKGLWNKQLQTWNDALLSKIGK